MAGSIRYSSWSGYCCLSPLLVDFAIQNDQRVLTEFSSEYFNSIMG